MFEHYKFCDIVSCINILRYMGTIASWQMDNYIHDMV